MMVAAQQLLLGIGWWIAATLMRSARTAALYWGAFAVLTGLSLMLFVLGIGHGDELLRALGNITAVLAVLALQHGVRCFFGVPSPWAAQTVWLAVCLAASAIGFREQHGAWRVGVISALLALVNIAIAWDLRSLAGSRMNPRWGLALALPIATGGLVFAARAVRAWLSPHTVDAEVAADSALNIGSALLYLALTLVFQLTLISLMMSRLVLDLRRLARRDPLTGLLNRRAIDEAIDDEVQRSRRLGSVFSVLMIDVDHFKALNDREGHAAGDRALQHLATLMSAQTREIDRLGRWGGEEFVMLLPGASYDAAMAMAERLRERTASLPLIWNDTPCPLTISIGVAQWRGEADGIAQLLARADAALYRAKARGRNCCEMELAPLA
jgi:diguanylate cyclase (GGDEF)-like protein